MGVKVGSHALPVMPPILKGNVALKNQEFVKNGKYGLKYALMSERICINLEMNHAPEDAVAISIKRLQYAKKLRDGK
jgi:hypothetical protein